MNLQEQTVAQVFLGRLTELGRGRSGAALAITLAFVMPVYLTVIGIYAVGEVVRNKIELQNAADSAAYSAAVVQADYLSRMATVNKAMAWTYIDLQKRSLDLAMDSFCLKVIRQFQSDVNDCIRNNKPCHMHAPGVNWNCGTDVLVINTVLNLTGCGVGIPYVAKEFNGQNFWGRTLLNHLIKLAEANIKGKGIIANEPKVLKYSWNIVKMMKILTDLRSDYEKKVKETAQQVAVANMMECKDDFYVKVYTGDVNLSLLPLPSTDDGEKDFIAMGDPTLKSFEPKKVFGPGTDFWVKRKGPVGFWRVYTQTKTHLYAEWDWFWTRWVHFQWPYPPVTLHLPPITPGGGYDHGHRKYHGYDGILPIVKNNLPIGLAVVPAIPLKVLPTYFGKSGSVCVSIIRKTSNPLSFFSWGGRSMTASGILSAFNPSVAGGNRPEFMCAVATARAGYKQYDSDKDRKLSSSDYTVGYVSESREKNWNLSETDWDAVMLPVKHAWSLCAGAGRVQTFVPTDSGILKEMVVSRKDWVDSKLKPVSENKLPDWEKLQPPGGLIADEKAKDKKLDWEKLRDYLGH